LAFIKYRYFTEVATKAVIVVNDRVTYFWWPITRLQRDCQVSPLPPPTLTDPTRTNVNTEQKRVLKFANQNSVVGEFFKNFHPPISGDSSQTNANIEQSIF